MKVILIGLVLFSQTILLNGQQLLPTNFSYHSIVFQHDSVHILLYQKNGDENKVKPLFLFIQGSLPIPLIIIEGDNAYPVFPFNPDSLSTNFHLAIVGKPGLPLVADVNELNSDMTYLDSQTRNIPVKFSNNDYPDYYINRENAVIKYFQKKNFVAKNELVVAGHSAGATIATGITVKNRKVSHLIYAAGNPYGRIVTMVAASHKRETDTTSLASEEFKYWEYLVGHNNESDTAYHGSNRTTLDFSKPVAMDLLKLKVPVLVVFGSKDLSSPYNDLLTVEAIRNKKMNMSFQCYTGLEHNFFGMYPDGTINYDNFNWDKVAGGWNRWLTK